MKEVYLYKKLKKKKVQCQNCAHYCILTPGERGKCGVRENINGKLYSLVYGKACAIHIDPIEKKPFFHFLPGTYSLSIATVGCNFACTNCQNWIISQGPKIGNKIEGEEIKAEEIVNLALKNNLPSISYTFTEPTIFLDYALDTMKIAKKKGLKNNWVTNAFWSKEAFDLIYPYLDAANVDLKSFSDEFYIKNCNGRLQPVLDNLKRLKEKKIWLEVTTLVIPTLSDDPKMLRKIAEFIKNELGPETPWHVTQFSGIISWKLQHLPNTPVETLKKAYKIGRDVGLKYVYTGNVPGLSSENAFCPKCRALVISRRGYSITRYDENGKCPQCNTKLDLVW